MKFLLENQCFSGKRKVKTAIFNSLIGLIFAGLRLL